MPNPPPGGGVGGGEPEAFSRLLRQLNEQHQREVAELHYTIEDLRRTIARTTQPLQVSKALGDRYTLDSCGNGTDEVLELQQRNADPATSQGHGVVSSAAGGVLSAPGPRCRAGSHVEVAASNDVGIAVLEEQDTENNHELAAPERSSTTSSKFKRSNSGSRLRAPVNKLHSRLEEVLHKSERERTAGREAIVDTVIGICIVANIVFMFTRLEYEGYKTGVKVGILQPGNWPDLDLVFEVAQHLFCIIFLLELIGRIAAYRMKFFYSDQLEKFNIFDAIIVLFTCIDLYIVAPFISDGHSSDLTVIRAARFARLLRAMRVVRTFEIFSKLRVLFSTVAASFFALLWSMVLLFITILIAALIMTQLVLPYLEDPRMSEHMVAWMYQHYGTAGRSLWTMFEVTFSGGWPQYARALVEEVSAWFAAFFALYVSCIVFAMTRIITALFLKDTLEVASNDAEMMIHEKMREKKSLAAKLLDVFIVADQSGDGRISWEEFESFFEDPKIRSYMSSLELDAAESHHLFAMLDDGDGFVTAEEFVQGAVRLKGAARSQDVVHMMHDFNKMTSAVDLLRERVDILHSKTDAVHKTVVPG